jgi:hypothetical protein
MHFYLSDGMMRTLNRTSSARSINRAKIQMAAPESGAGSMTEAGK